MVLNQLKQIRDELKQSGDAYDAAFRNTALIAAQELVSQEQQLKSDRQTLSNLKQDLDKQYFITNYGSFKNAKIAYHQIYGQQKYGRSWSDFIAVAKKLTASDGVPLTLPEQTLTLEQRVTKLENFLSSLGYQR